MVDIVMELLFLSLFIIERQWIIIAKETFDKTRRHPRELFIPVTHSIDLWFGFNSSGPGLLSYWTRPVSWSSGRVGVIKVSHFLTNWTETRTFSDHFFCPRKSDQGFWVNSPTQCLGLLWSYHCVLGREVGKGCLTKEVMCSFEIRQRLVGLDRCQFQMNLIVCGATFTFPIRIRTSSTATECRLKFVPPRTRDGGRVTKTAAGDISHD